MYKKLNSKSLTGSTSAFKILLTGERRELRIVTRLLAGYQGNCGSLPYSGNKFISSTICSKNPGAYAASYLLCTGAVSRGIKQSDLEAKHHRMPGLRINGAIPPPPINLHDENGDSFTF